MGETGRAVLVAVVTSVVAVTGTIWASSLGYFNKDRELDIRMVEISLSILKGENKGTDSAHARRFALRALRKYSSIDLSDDELESWVESGDLPYETVSEVLGHYDLGGYGGGWADDLESNKTGAQTLNPQLGEDRKKK